MNLANTIIPKSDQLNADDLIAGPRTIKIVAVESGSAEQPVTIRYDGDAGHPYKPSKGMRRVLVSMWGSEGAAYVGKRLTLFNDPAVTFGPDKTGGIRISHADISEPVEIALTVKRGKRKPFIVQPMAAEKTVDLFAYEQTGNERAAEGSEALKAWWLSLPAAIRSALTAKKDAEWKPGAEKADKAR